MAPLPLASVLFHPKPKKYVPGKKETKEGSSSPKKPRVPRPKPKTETDDDMKPEPPEGPYSEYRLMSSALNGWKYDVMKFDSRKPVDIAEWPQPVKLNRKEPRRGDSGPSSTAPQAVGPMLGPDGKPVIGMDGRVVMVDAEGKPIRPGETQATGSGEGGKDKAAGKKKFQKKTKQVFLVPEATRQLRREERFPWVMEDATKKEVWVGKVEEVSKSETHAMFMPAANDVFKFVPAHRWYKFQKKPNYHIPNLEEAESLMTKRQKNKDPERWLLHYRNSAESGGAGSLVHTSGESLGPGGRKLRTVDSGTSRLFGDDDDEEGVDSKRRMEKELGAEGDVDEFDFEDDFADDDEKVVDDQNQQEEEEAKELEERLKREYRTANKQREGYIDESDEETEETKLTGAGMNLKKTLRKLEKDTGYDDSDEEENPYASSVEEEEEEEPPQVSTGPAIQPPPPRNPTRSISQAPSPTTTAAPRPPTGTQTPVIVKSESLSRATSPVPQPGHGGHLVIAQRATSPKVMKLKPSNPSRAGSPLAGGTVTSPSGSRATSPVASAPTSVPPALGVNIPNGKVNNNKRKATDDPTSPTAGSVKPKKRRPQPPGVELEDKMVIDWLRNNPSATTRDCIQHFTPYLTEEAKKSKFTALVKEVAQLKGGVLVLRPAYRGSAAPSPTATPAVS